MRNHFHLLVRVTNRLNGFDVPVETVVGRWLEQALREEAVALLRTQLEFRGCSGMDSIQNPTDNSKSHGNYERKGSNPPASNFDGGRYQAITLEDDVVLYRGGKLDVPYGEWFTRSPAQSIANVRIDLAVKVQWLDNSKFLEIIQISWEIT